MFFSFPGQSLFMGMFSERICQDFGWSSSEYGFYYSLTSLISAGVLFILGGYVDKYLIRKVSLLCGFFMMISLTAAGYTENAYVFIVSIFAIRFFSQCFTHIAYTSVNRYFIENRGKATAVSSLGLPMAEIIVPSVVGIGLTFMHWQNLFIYISITGFIIFVFLVLNLIEKRDTFQNVNSILQDFGGKIATAQMNRSEVLKDPKVYFYIPLTLVIPFVMTGFFIHQGTISSKLGWQSWWLAAGLSSYGISRFVIPFIAGYLVDKFSAKTIFSFHIIPVILGFITLVLFKSIVAVCVFFMLTGISVGLGAITFNTLFAELYGIKYLGSIKSLFKPFIVAASAVGPLCMGFVMEYCFSIEDILLASILLFSLTTLLVFIPSFMDKTNMVDTTSKALD